MISTRNGDGCIAVKRPRFWCYEDVLSLAILTELRVQGHRIILSSSGKGLIEFSKSDLVKANAKLSPMAMQGRNFIDISAVIGSNLLVGVVLSRLFVIAIKNGENHVEQIAKLILATPQEAEEAYGRLKDMGYDLTSTNIAKLYKILVVTKSIYTLRRWLDEGYGLSVVVVVPCLYMDKYKAMLLHFMRKLLDFVKRVHGLDVKEIGLYCFKPLDIEAHSPSIVEVKHVAEALVMGRDSFRIPFGQYMGYDYAGCKKCKYLEVCYHMIGR